MSVLSLDQAKTHLNITVATHDAELQTFIDASEAALAKKCGPLVATSTTVKIQHFGGPMSLPITPALSLTSITDSGGVVASLTGLSVSTEGVVNGTTFAADLYTVVYQAGRSSTPADLLMAVKELVRHLFGTQRGPTLRPGSTTSEATANTVPGAAYLLPFRVSELIADYVQVP